MRYLYHVAPKMYKESILERGLIIWENSPATESINSYLELYKPNNITFDRSKCIFFYTKLKDCISFNDDIYRINVKDLDLDKLYVVEYTYAQNIWQDLEDAPYTGEYAPIPTKESAKLYWKSLRPYQEYLKDKKEYIILECLYLDNVPWTKLTLLK